MREGSGDTLQRPVKKRKKNTTIVPLDAHGRFICQFKNCGKEILRDEIGSNYYSHLKECHATGPDFACHWDEGNEVYCKKSYKSKDALIKHVRNVHIGLWRFTCDTCNETFDLNDQLERHKNERKTSCALRVRGSALGVGGEVAAVRWTNFYGDS